MGTARDHNVTKLYNYQPTINYLEDLLRKNHIHCSNPENFNDPWDCKPYFDSSSIDDSMQRCIWIEFFKEQHAALPLHKQAEIVAEHGAGWYENTELLRASIVRTTKHACKNNADRYRIFCLTTKPTSLLMWAHYANKHQGICLEFDSTQEKVRHARKVVYADKFPIANADVMRNPDDLLEVSLLTKSTEWSYEEEYRLLARDGSFDPSFSLATDGNFLKLPADAITAVIAGCQTNFEEVREIVRRVTAILPVKRAVRRPDEFHLTIVDE